jgi:hypothetical protein
MVTDDKDVDVEAILQPGLQKQAVNTVPALGSGQVAYVCNNDG